MHTALSNTRTLSVQKPWRIEVRLIDSGLFGFNKSQFPTFQVRRQAVDCVERETIHLKGIFTNHTPTSQYLQYLQLVCCEVLLDICERLFRCGVILASLDAKLLQLFEERVLLLRWNICESPKAEFEDLGDFRLRQVSCSIGINSALNDYKNVLIRSRNKVEYN